jgi:predicted PurR-regulated permease PerM
MARVTPSLPPSERDPSRTVITIGAVIAALYFGKEIFVPIALAILLSFALAPAVRKLHAMGLGRIFPVLLTTLLAFTLIFSLAGLVASQLREIAGELPRYEATMTRKVATLKEATSGGALQRMEDLFARLDRTINKTPAPPSDAPVNQDRAPAPNAQKADEQPPLQVEVRQPAPTPIETIQTYATPLIHPLATAGIVVIFVIFILLQREDLRNRLIRLFGASDLQRTTAAIDDGAKRLSRYFLTQLLINTVAGLVVGGAAWILSVPNPVLWAILFACLRFVPYVGPIIGGVMPVLFAAAVDNGWSTAIWMAGLILAAELIIGQVIEPLVYGHNTGLTPVAVVLAATFWTALWGPIGLLLAVPITVCVVVVGRHVEQLEFLDVLLGDRPPLTAPETFYQRMLANDPVEVADQADQCRKTMSLTDYYDDVILPGLLLAQADATAERLTVPRQLQIRDATEDVIEDLGEDDDSTGPGRGRWHFFGQAQRNAEEGPRSSVDDPGITPGWRREGSIVCIGGRGPLDDCAALMLAQLLAKRGLGARSESYEMLSKAHIESLDLSRARLICLSCLDGSSAAYLRFALRRVRRRAPRAMILIGAWWLQAQGLDAADELRSLSDPISTTLVDAVRHCLASASALTEEELTGGSELVSAELPKAS